MRSSSLLRARWVVMAAGFGMASTFGKLIAAPVKPRVRPVAKPPLKAPRVVVPAKTIKPRAAGSTEVVNPPVTAGATGAIIRYTLPKAGRVSLAIYDAKGRMVRTLASGSGQQAGENTTVWDGLDREGKAVPAGSYTWKLLLSQGMKAEYLMALGTSFGINHWIGQHGGPNTVAAFGDRFVAGGHPEGSPMMGIAGFDGSYKAAIGNLLTGGSPVDMAVDKGTLFALITGGSLFALDAKTTGMRLHNKLLALPVRSLGGIPATQKGISMSYPVAPGQYLVKMKIGQEEAATGRMSATWNNRWFGTNQALAPGKYEENIQSRVWDSYGALSPDANGKLTFNASPMDKDQSIAIADMQLLAIADRMDARCGELAATFQGADTVAWIEPGTAKILEQVKVPQARGVALAAPGVALVLSGNSVVRATRDGRTETVLQDLPAPQAIAFDPPTGGLWIYDGTAQQVKYFNRDFNGTKTLGRKGGRQQGLYVPEDFLAVADLASDGQGGFFVAEDNSAPRRVAHFDGDGKLLNEWYGGQQFYTFAAVDPANPSRIWMDSQWGWVMECEVDWVKRSWKVRSCYGWGGGFHGSFSPPKAMAFPHFVRSLDLNKDGKRETYLGATSQPGSLLLVDEAARRLRPVALLGQVNPGQFWGITDAPPGESQPEPWKEAVQKAGGNYKDRASMIAMRGFGWADGNNDGQVQGDELRVGGSVGASHLTMDNDLNIYLSADYNKKSRNPAWQRIPASGFTKDGYPMWDWNKKELGPVSGYVLTREMRRDSAGNLYGLEDGGAGDGFVAPDTYGMGHGATWPANQTDSNALIKWDKDGNQLWQVGAHSSRGAGGGLLNYPVHLAGIANQTIGVCDKIIQPVVFWTTDGLYAGGLFDRRADDGLPLRIYRWWTGGTDDFHGETGRSPIQYDMALGGSLLKLGNGDVIFIGSGWNNCPAYKVTGWDEFQRQTGTILVEAPAKASAQSGTGLQAEYFADSKLQGEASLKRIEPRIWFDAAKKQFAASYVWPETAAQKNAYAARWTGMIEPKFTEEYVFSVYGHNGGARLWLGGRLLIQSEGTQNGDWKLFSPGLPLRAGERYPVKLEWTGAGGSGVHLNWESSSQPISHIPATSLYPDAADASLPQLSIRAEQAVLKRNSTQPIRILVSRTGSIEQALYGGYTISGTAAPGKDYEPLSGDLIFPPGESVVPINIISVPTGTVDSPELRLTLKLSPRYYVSGPGWASVTVGVPSGISFFRFANGFNALGGSTDTQPLAGAPEAKQWQLTANATMSAPNGGSLAVVEVLDTERKPIVNFFLYRGDPIPNVTSNNGHINYAVYNQKELAHSGEPWMEGLYNPDIPVNVTVKDGLARLRWGSKVDTERPVLAGNWKKPAFVQTRSISTGRVVLTNAVLRITDAAPATGSVP